MGSNFDQMRVGCVRSYSLSLRHRFPKYEPKRLQLNRVMAPTLRTLTQSLWPTIPTGAKNCRSRSLCTVRPRVFVLRANSSLDHRHSSAHSPHFWGQVNIPWYEVENGTFLPLSTASQKYRCAAHNLIHSQPFGLIFWESMA